MMQSPTQSDLIAEVAALHRELTHVRQEKQNLELMLEVAMQHSDAITDDLRSEKEDLAVLLEMNTEHADAVEEELHHKAEEALRASERRLRMIVQATPVPVFINRVRDGVIVFANGMSGPLLGVATEALVGCNIAAFYGDAANYQALLTAFEQRGEIDRYEVHLRRCDGVAVWAEVSLRALDFGNEPSLLCALHDITERIAYEVQLKRLNDELEDRNRLLGRLGVEIAHGARTPLLNATDVSDLLPELIEIGEYEEILTLSAALGEKARTGLQLLSQQLDYITQLIGAIKAKGAEYA